MMTIPPDAAVDIPKWHEFMTPILRVLSDEKPYSRRELYGATSNSMDFTDDQTSILLSSGQPKVENRIGWAMSALTQAGAVERPARATYRITDIGRQALRDFPDRITQSDLKTFPQWVAHKEIRDARRAGSGDEAARASVDDST